MATDDLVQRLRTERREVFEEYERRWSVQLAIALRERDELRAKLAEAEQRLSNAVDWMKGCGEAQKRAEQKLAEAERAKGEPIAWMVGNDPMTAAVYNKGEKEKAFDAARRWKTSITGLVPCDGAPVLATPPAPSPSVQAERPTTAVHAANAWPSKFETAFIGAERPIVLPLLGPADLLVECAQSFVEGWTIARVQDFARAAVELDRSKKWATNAELCAQAKEARK